MASPVRPCLSSEDLAALLVRAYERGEKCPPATEAVLKAVVLGDAKAVSIPPSESVQRTRISRRMLLAGFRQEG
jgi:hypothetical protein